MDFHELAHRSTLADANELRIYVGFAQGLIMQARKLYLDEELELDLSNRVYALNSTIIDLCLSAKPYKNVYQSGSKQ